MGEVDDKYRRAARRIIRRLPPDLLRELIELEQQGRLGPVIEAALDHAAVTQHVANVVAGHFRADVSPVLRGVIRSVTGEAARIDPRIGLHRNTDATDRST